MNTIWVCEQVLRQLGEKGHSQFADVLSAIEASPPAAYRTHVDFDVTGAKIRAAQIIEGVTGIFDALPVFEDAVPGPWRDLILTSDAVEEFVSHKDWPGLYSRLRDVANIEAARERGGLKYLRQKNVHSIFAPGGYHRLHFVCEPPNYAAILGLFDAQPWATHSASSGIRQPPANQLSAFAKLQQAAHDKKLLLPPIERPKVIAQPTAAPLCDGWVTLNRLRELGIASEDTMRLVLSMQVEDDLLRLMDALTDAQYDALERAFQQRLVSEARRRERRLSTLEVYQLRSAGRQPSNAASFDATLELLSEDQRNVVQLERDVPVRLQGGPGTGKTFTAVLRAGFMARRAETRGEGVRIGFFVFNSDLGAKVLEQMVGLGLEKFLDATSPQHIEITSLHEWCARFINIAALGVEPLPPYRAERGDADRLAALRLAVEEARRRLMGSEYDALWSQFDARSRNGLWEIETEISQFIKARDITDLTSYLNEKRPAGWWLAGAEKAFKRFVWEISVVYNETLRALGFVDSDDLTNDAIKEVSKTTWQQFHKPKLGFDYLILDEAQDFFRNQLTLLRHLVKRPEGLMMCFDQAQAVYARYPSLRDIGFDTDVRFHGTRLEQNYRSTRQIVAALHQLIGAYPMLGLIDNWGAFQTGSEGHTGARPVACGFAGEAAMFAQARDLIRAHLAAGGTAEEVAVIGFDDELLGRAAAFLGDAKVRYHHPESDGKRMRGAVTLASARQIKGQQFELSIIIGADRDRMPDFSHVKSELHRETRREDDLRLFIVALSRCKRSLHILWSGTQPSEFVTAMGDAVDRQG